MHGRCHILLWLNEFSVVAISCFTLSRYDYLNGSITHTTGRLAHTVVQFSCLVKVMESKLVISQSSLEGPCDSLLDNDKQSTTSLIVFFVSFFSSSLLCLSQMPDNITVTTGSTIRLITGKYGSLCGASFPLNVDYVFFGKLHVVQQKLKGGFSIIVCLYD